MLLTHAQHTMWCAGEPTEQERAHAITSSTASEGLQTAQKACHWRVPLAYAYQTRQRASCRAKDLLCYREDLPAVAADQCAGLPNRVSTNSLNCLSTVTTASASIQHACTAISVISYCALQFIELLQQQLRVSFFV
jgi:hypothetical protein